MKVLSIQLVEPTMIPTPFDEVEKYSISTKSNHDWTWELNWIQELRMVAVTAIENGTSKKRRTSHVPVENIRRLEFAPAEATVRK